MKLKIFFTAGILVVLTGISSCSKIGDFGNLNQNPGQTTQPITSALLTNSLAGIANYTWDQGGLTTVAGLYSQYFSETQYTDISTYSKQTRDWDGYYAGSLYDLQIIINYNSDPNTAAIAAANGSNNNQIAVARILKAYFFSLLTDSYGDLPYSGALKGGNGIVVFDKQQDVYTDLFKELDEAVKQIDGGTPATGDILFNGDISRWKQFANSIRALLALNLSKVDPATGKTQFNAALSADGGVINSLDNGGQDITITAPGGNFFNPIYNYYVITQRLDYAVSKTVTDWLSTNKDNRLSAYGTSTIGFPYGLTRGDAVTFANANTGYAKLITGLSAKPTDPFNIISAAEIDLARAEAAQLGWTSESASALYAAGIKDSWTSWGVYNDADYAAYIAQPAIALTEGTEIQKIATQEWISHYPAGTRGWNVWRRTGYPNLTPAPGAITQIIPRRFSYGLHEYSTNTANVTAASAQYTVNGDNDSQLGRIWWDKQ